MADGGVGSFSFFKTMLIVQIFFAICITIIVYGLQGLDDNAVRQIGEYSAAGDRVDINELAEDIETGLSRELNMPLIDVGALVFYSGNIIIDLLLNFAFAIPIMLGLLVSSFHGIFPAIDPFFVGRIQLISSIIFGVLYVFGFIQMVIGIRSGRVIT